MEEFSVKAIDNQIIITIDRSLVDIDSVNNLLVRLRIEQLIKKANFSEDVMKIAEEIKKNWWKENKDRYLEGYIDADRD
ncbi:MAG TPA: hypothetical protein VI387_01990 [Candidatus Brocadiales bacterium]|nr:hypothetical protein [Candidatus Brocadiales bacterium]